MKRAGPPTLERIAALLDELRRRPGLSEGRPGVFELKSREVLHFHDDASGIFADLRLAEGRVRLRVTSSAEQSDLLDRIDASLSVLEARKRDRGRRDARRRGRGPKEV